MGDLEPCPFCGASAQISTRTDECIWSHDQVEWTAVSCSGGPDFDCFQPSVDWPTSATDDHGTQLSISQWNRRATPAAAAPPIPPLRYFFAEGDTLDQMRDHARAHPIAGEGDMKLVWANEGDIYNHSAPFFREPAAAVAAVRAAIAAVLNKDEGDGE